MSRRNETPRRIPIQVARLALIPLLAWLTACSLQPGPVWVVGEGQGLLVPWRKPGEALRSARETAVQEARLRIRGQLLAETILPRDGGTQQSSPASPTSPTSPTSPAGPPHSTDLTSSTIPASASTAGLLPLDHPTSATWRIDTTRRAWSSEEKALLKTMTIEQLAAISPAFRAKFDHMIGNLDPLSVSQSPDGTVVVRMRMDKNEALRLARKYLDQQTRL